MSFVLVRVFTRHGLSVPQQKTDTQTITINAFIIIIVILIAMLLSRQLP